MTRLQTIVLGFSAGIAPEGRPARAASAPHWGRWRRGGVLLSAALHGAALLAVTVTLPALGSQHAQQDPVTVEIVPRAPDPKPQAKPPEPEKRAEPKTQAEKPLPQPPKPLAEKKAAAPPKPDAPPAGERTPPPPPPARAQAAPSAPLRTPSPPANALRLPTPEGPPQRLALAPGLGPPPAAPREAPRSLPAPPQATRTAAGEGPPNPADKGVFGHWVLEPVRVNAGHRCGESRISGVIDLKEKVAAGRFRGTLRTRIDWALCPPEGALYHVEMRVSGDEVLLVGAEGFTDHGVIGNGVMMLRDSYGTSVWLKR